VTEIMCFPSGQWQADMSGRNPESPGPLEVADLIVLGSSRNCKIRGVSSVLAGKAAAIVHGVISIAQGLGIGVVAEGVETRQQVQLLQRRHCDLGQGYLFAQPLPAASVPEFLRSWSGIPGPAQAPTPAKSD
jgi:hypothetical protein